MTAGSSLEVGDQVRPACPALAFFSAKLVTRSFDRPDSLARAGGREDEDVLGPGMSDEPPRPRESREPPPLAIGLGAETGVHSLTEHNPGVVHQTGRAEFGDRRPPR